MAASTSAQWCADCGSTSIEAVATTPPPANWAPPTSAAQQVPAQQVPAQQWAAPQPPSGQWAAPPPASPAGYPSQHPITPHRKAGVFGAAIALVWSLGTLLRTVLFVEDIVDRRQLGFGGFDRITHPGNLFSYPRFLPGKLNGSIFGPGWSDKVYVDPRTLAVAAIAVIALVALATRKAQIVTVLMVSLAVFIAGTWLLGVDSRWISLSLRLLVMASVLPVAALVVALIERAASTKADPAPAFGTNVL